MVEGGGGRRVSDCLLSQSSDVTGDAILVHVFAVILAGVSCTERWTFL
jgi:hypothetical protein